MGREEETAMQQSADEAQIRLLVENWARAVRAKDITRVVADHTDDVLMFDVPPPVAVRGISAYGDTWPQFFKWLTEGKGAFDIVELHVTAGVKANPQIWHFGFHQTLNLPEKLLAGRQLVYFRHFFDRLALNTKAITDAEVRHYARAYASQQQLRAGLEFYRSAYPAAEKFNAAERSAIDVPIVLAGGDHAMGMLLPRLGDSLRQHGCTNIIVEVVRDSGHWVIDEQPDIVAELIEHHASR
jgi:pimeloyl-ACP methyl ester carboxylesterase